MRPVNSISRALPLRRYLSTAMKACSVLPVSMSLLSTPVVRREDKVE